MSQAASFLGIFRHTVDDQHRVSIPARFREQLAKTGQALLYAVAREDHIVLLPQEAWSHFVARLYAEESSKGQAQDYDYLRRQVALAGEICRIDSQGRISLRPDQMKTAGIDADAVVVFGNVRVIELWSEPAFEKMADKARSQDRSALWLEVTRCL